MKIFADVLTCNMVAFNSTHAIGNAQVVEVGGDFDYNDLGNTWFTIQMTGDGIVVDRVVDRAYQVR